jgi:hypothetical protein
VGLPEELDGLEQQIRRLQIEWEKFFGGVERKPPTEFATRVEALIRRYAGEELRNNSDRFRYHGLTARYNTMNELWNKKLRAREEGRPVGIHGARAEHLAMERQAHMAPSAPHSPPQGQGGEVRVTSPEQDQEAVRALFERFVEARKSTGETASVRFENFQKMIAQQASRILTEKGARAVDFRLETKDGKVSLKARPIR